MNSQNSSLDLQELSQQTYVNMQQYLEKLDLNQLEKEAFKLIEIGNSVFRQQVKGVDHPFIPLPIVLKVIEVLSHDSIQWCDNTKYLLSKVCRIFSEIVLCQIFTKERCIYPSTRENMIRQLQTVLSTLPETEVATLFEVERSIATFKGLKPGTGLFKEIGKKEGVGFLGSGAAALGTGSLGQLCLPSVGLLKQLYSELSETWYPQTFTLEGNLKGITQLSEFNFFQSDIGCVESCRRAGRHFSFYLVNMFMEILQNNDASPELKDRILHGLSSENPGLLHLADLTGSTKDFWRIRYRVAEYLNVLSEDPGKREVCINKLAHRFIEEPDPLVAQLLHTFYTTSSLDKQKIWNQNFFKIGEKRLEDCQNKNQEKTRLIAEKLRKQKEELERKKREAPNSQSLLQASSLVISPSDLEKEEKALKDLLNQAKESEREEYGHKVRGSNLDLVLKLILSQSGENS